MKYRECPICGEKIKSILFKQRFSQIRSITFLEGYEVVSCNNCGFIYADNIPSQSEFDEYYRESSKYEEMNLMLTEAAKEKFEKSLEFMISCVNENNVKLEKMNFVDIGCATGDFLRFLKKKGFNLLTGIDPSIECVKFIEKHGINAKQSAINGISGEKKFDFIRLNAVLEHIVNLDQTIKKLKESLNNNGYIYISVPNVDGFKKLDNCPFQEFSVEHINYFSINTLTLLMRKYGFNLIDYRINQNVSYSEIEAVFIYDNLISNENYIYDSKSQDSIKEYIKNSFKLEAKTNKKLEALAVSKEPIIVWGVGTHTLRQLECGQLSKCNIKLFVDNNQHYQNKEYKGISIVSPSELVKYNYKIVISSYYAQKSIINYAKDELKIENELVKLF